MEDIVQLVIFLAVVFFSLLVSGSKKKRQAQQRKTERPPVRQSRRAATADAEPKRGSLAREIMELIQAQIPEPVVEQRVAPPAPAEPESREAVSLEVIEEEAQSLETLDADANRRHQEFHERYVDRRKPKAAQSRPSRFRRITPRTAREAVIWKTIFSPPKGLE